MRSATQSTIRLTGIGPVRINTDLNEVILVGAMTVNGDFVNCKTKTVRRNKTDAKAAEKNALWLKEVAHGYFMVMQD